MTSHHRTANAIPLLETATSSHGSGVRRIVTNGRDSFMGGNVGPTANSRYAQTHVQCEAIPQIRKRRTRSEHEAHCALLNLDRFSTRSAAESLGWAEHEARYWIEKFRARGWLDSDRRCHWWTEKGRAA